ncbi:hypothetical protein DFQ28_010146 [Apophysomyces sp. BC1034]|nr:hypothetical protein DFQ30_006637 [Apophysomyces sp. BC1015]KAG0176819.1 hypothetical protein DFQ29_005593 [Apophysomyces sp. BC1021]KAG0184983.1 hypothetical protein DFQ28_010146 [Apophysomyces sp. BC1034]
MPTAMQMQSISGIITQVRVTSGDIPPPLVGASTTVIDDRVFVFGGCLVSSHKVTNHMYVLDLKSFVWTRHIPSPDSDELPSPRYFHSANVYNNSWIVIFGGIACSASSGQGLCVLNSIALFDTTKMAWKCPTIQPSLFSPMPRYAPLAAINQDKLIVIGGQDLNNNYVNEINVFDLQSLEWIQSKPFEKQAGAYRAVAVTTPPGTRLPVVLKDGLDGKGNNDEGDCVRNNNKTDNDLTHRASLVRQYSQSLQATPEHCPVYVYSNYEFADVKRELHLISTSLSSSPSTIIEDCSSFITGSTMPPGLRFPTGYTLGHHLVLAGTFLSAEAQSYSIWALDLDTLTWSRIETGPVFGSGSWNRGVLHMQTNRFLVLGNRDRNLLEDYNHRHMNFEHVATVDLEAFGVYRLPKPTCSTLAQEMGLTLLNEPAVSDFQIITRENHRIPVNSAVLRQRWPYFAELICHSAPVEEGAASGDNRTSGQSTKSVLFPYPYPVVVALLQFIYTDNLLTAQQYQPHILSQLLLLADMYDLRRLRELVTHALHQMLNMSTAPLIFETAALSHQTSLQIRALKMMIAAKRVIQQQQQQQQQQQERLPSPPTTPQQQPQRSRSEPSTQELPSSPQRQRASSIINNIGLLRPFTLRKQSGERT